MALSLESISKGRAIKAPRIVLLGVEKVGKSTFGSQSDSPIFIPMKGEQGIDGLDVAKFPPAQTYEDIIDAIRILYQDQHDYKTVVLDSTSAAEPIIWDKACKAAGVDSIEKVGGGFGKGYVEVLKFWREIMDGFDALRDDRGMTTVLIGHVKAKEFNDPEADPYTTYMFDVHDKTANSLYRWADCILFAGFKKAIVQKSDAGFNKTKSRATGSGQRVLYTEKRPAHPGGNRYSLPYELPLSWSKFMEALASKATTPVMEPAA